MRAVGIDLGTTNSEVAIVENGQARVLPGEDGDLILPSCVGFSDTGKLLVGREALRQYAAAPERTVKSIKRWMGTDHKTTLDIGVRADAAKREASGNETREYLPHEISAIILRSLKQRAESALGEPVTQAVITVPAYFTDAQRQATKTAGEIAGLEVLQIINEPTAAALAYDLRSEDTEKVLVYDLGGGTFDVSVVEITGDVTEVLASHGNNRLGGDDFDRLLQLHLANIFRKQHSVDVPDDAATQARLLRAAEQLKIELSSHGFATVREAFLGSKGKTPLHLEVEVARTEFEELIQPLLKETLEAIDRALSDANLKPDEIDRIILVGGSTRIPLVQTMIEEHLGQPPTDGIQPDLCVALGAALQAGVLVGESVDSILVDVIPHSLGIAAAVDTALGIMPGYFSVIIPRNSVVPVSRSEVYSTLSDNQEAVEIEVFQGENPIAEENVPLGSFKVENLPPKPAGSIQVEVHFDFDINGILTVTTTEKSKGQQGTLVVNNTGIQRLSSNELNQARQELDALFESDETVEISSERTIEPIEIDPELQALLNRAEKVIETLDDEQAEELQDLLDQIEDAIAEESSQLPEMQQELEDFLYYASSNEEA
ncbi:Hsp70 family protein [Aetokthonos hydrillicola Thurmond2011]|jgi:molecular chaperone DnaK|uniref:Hsp70 family protein n=1 Tax=Aetokthonos hydrillicola Thurmond2011 TaxID=2712845 RepID=A0AAP5I8G7_9CYAN|nr:Hsp70 family protein [Aetokthonos hydrillicola]MBO3460446.1 Hsp70 family protein [Aetokthonos hydrillicola CCALA 1050]MBW4588477.1 Hsp70 family protein [Aetokthonos hydrillicola CCALA 1050]MDR9896806.1 Hsp70 family protein [Aetokthonos hydrillicola Thurmond2011]